MQYRRFGKTDLTVSELGFGCARIGGVFQGSSRSELHSLLRRSFDAGITFFDTADMYTQGESERLIGDAFGGLRERVIIASKGGYVLPTQQRLVSRLKPFLRPVVAYLGIRRRTVNTTVRGSIARQDFSPAYLTRAVEASLRRLRTDYIDIYQLHAPSLDVLARGEFVEQLEILRQQGKIRYWGVAGDGPEHVESALAYSNLGAVQVGLSALEQTALDHAIPCATEHGVGVIARQVFASGLLTRDPESIATEVLDPEPSVGRRKHDQLRAFASIARVCGRTRTELALQFSLAQDGVSVVLVGLSRPNQLTDIERALNAPSLTLHERRALSATSHEPSPVTSAAPLPLA